MCNSLLINANILYAFLWVIIQKKAYNMQNTAKVWNQECKHRLSNLRSVGNISIDTSNLLHFKVLLFERFEVYEISRKTIIK